MVFLGEMLTCFVMLCYNCVLPKLYLLDILTMYCIFGMALYTDWCKKCDEEIKYEYCEPVCLHVYMVIKQNWNVNNMTCNVKKKINLLRFYMCLCTKHKNGLVKKKFDGSNETRIVYVTYQAYEQQHS